MTEREILTFRQNFRERNFFLRSDHLPPRSVVNQAACAPQVV